MKKIICLLFFTTLITSCSDPKHEDETAVIDSTKVAESFTAIENVEMGVNKMKGFWYNPTFFDKIKISQKVKENLKDNYQYFYLNDEGLIQRNEGFSSQDYIPVTFSVADNKLLIYDKGKAICWVSFKNDSITILKSIGLNKDTLNITLKKLTGEASKKTELDQYEYLLAINTISGKYVNAKGEQIEFMKDGTFIGFDLNTEYFVEGLGYEGMDGDYEFDAISIKNEETLMSYKWTLANNVLTLTEIETSENSPDFKLSSKPLVFTKK
ncbi:MAG: hypothetical protein H0W73_04430 [Bacteroidetes bacterium]|nr:hypothetical protein [Bacteroidota bacterium]